MPWFRRLIGGAMPWLRRLIGEAVPWLRRIITGFTPRRFRFNTKPLRVVFMADKVALGQFSLPVLQFSPLSTIPQLLQSAVPSNSTVLVVSVTVVRGLNKTLKLDKYIKRLIKYQPHIFANTQHCCQHYIITHPR